MTAISDEYSHELQKFMQSGQKVLFVVYSPDLTSYLDDRTLRNLAECGFEATNIRVQSRTFSQIWIDKSEQPPSTPTTTQRQKVRVVNGFGSVPFYTSHSTISRSSKDFVLSWIPDLKELSEYISNNPECVPERFQSFENLVENAQELIQQLINPRNYTTYRTILEGLNSLISLEELKERDFRNFNLMAAVFAYAGLKNLANPNPAIASIVIMKEDLFGHLKDYAQKNGIVFDYPTIIHSQSNAIYPEPEYSHTVKDFFGWVNNRGHFY
jgi:hypothetical protein